MEKDIAKEAKSNPKQLWKYANSKSKIRQGIPDLVKDENDKTPEYTTSDREKAEVNVKFYLNESKKLTK